jgi:hypothetical protein
VNEYVRRYEWHQPIVLIGHSFGGLVLKSLVVQLVKASTIKNPTNSLSEVKVQCAKMFLKNVRGVVFYSVPHAGSNIAEYVNKLLRCSNQNPTNSCWQAILQCAKVFLRNMRRVAFYAVPYPGSRSSVEFVNKLLRSNIIHHRGIIDNIQPWQGDMEELSVDFDDIVNENHINIYAFCEGRPMEQVVRICLKWIFCNQPPVMILCCLALSREFGLYDWTREFWWS